jgi:F0F1-type ATP synthase assembly protein I
MLGAQMEPQNRPPLQYAEAGGVLIGLLFACVALGLLFGWLAGSAGIGILTGSVVGFPLAVYTVYRRYREIF